MRQSLIIFFMLLYLTANSHLSLAMHFCCGKMVDWSLNSEAKRCCDKSETKKKCCSDFELNFGVVEQHASAQALICDLRSTFFLIIPFPGITPAIPMYCELAEPLIPAHAPPNLSAPEYYLLYDVFLI